MSAERLGFVVSNSRNEDGTPFHVCQTFKHLATNHIDTLPVLLTDNLENIEGFHQFQYEHSPGIRQRKPPVAKYLEDLVATKVGHQGLLQAVQNRRPIVTTHRKTLEKLLSPKPCQQVIHLKLRRSAEGHLEMWEAYQDDKAVLIFADEDYDYDTSSTLSDASGLGRELLGPKFEAYLTTKSQEFQLFSIHLLEVNGVFILYNSEIDAVDINRENKRFAVVEVKTFRTRSKQSFDINKQPTANLQGRLGQVNNLIFGILTFDKKLSRRRLEDIQSYPITNHSLQHKELAILRSFTSELLKLGESILPPTEPKTVQVAVTKSVAGQVSFEPIAEVA